MDNRISGNINVGSSPTRVDQRTPIDYGALRGGGIPDLSIARLSSEEKEAIDKLEQTIKDVQGSQRTFEFSVHEQTQAVMIKVYDKQSGELIREVPREKLLDVVASFMEINGLIIDKKA